MIKDDVKQLIVKLGFPSETHAEILSVLDKLLPISEFSDILSCYDDANFDFAKMLADTKQLAEENGICFYTAHMVLLLCLAPKLYQKYVQKGIAEQIFYDTMADLRYKLEECKLVHGKVGTFVANWYKGFFEMRIFALGRLQFEINHTWFDCEVNGRFLPKGTKVLSVHIPRTGTRLEHDLALDSYKMATEFFDDEFDGDVIFICNSWMLYPWNRTVFKEGSNLAQFFDDFTIVSSGEYQNYSECWRLFDCLYTGNPDALPNDTSLRRAYINRMKNGEPLGHGTGIILFDKKQLGS